MRPSLLIFALLLTVAGSVSGQVAGELQVYHSFPLAGNELVLLVEGPNPGAAVLIELEMAAQAPPSLQEFLASGAFGPANTLGDVLTVVGVADESGVLELRVLLDDLDDAGRLVALSFTSPGSASRAQCTLLVQPPTVVLPTTLGLQRVDLRTGRVLQPSLPGSDAVLGLALSADGRVGYVLREGGALELRSADAWDRRPTVVYRLDAGGDALAHGTASGPAFVIVRPALGEGFSGLPPAGRLQFLDARYSDLQIETLAQPVTGRRWAVSEDGLTAFVAEDDLLVREIDLISSSAAMPFTAGFNGDRSVSDMVVQGSRLLVLTRRGGGLPGALTVYDLASGWVRPYPLTVDPLRLVVIDDELALVVPASAAQPEGSLAPAPGLTRVLDGVPGAVDRPSPATGRGGQLVTRILDAAPVAGGALILASDTAGSRLLLSWDALNGLIRQPVSASLADSERLVAAGSKLAVLLGSSDGLARRVLLPDGVVEVLPGVTTLPGETFHVLP